MIKEAILKVSYSLRRIAIAVIACIAANIATGVNNTQNAARPPQLRALLMSFSRTVAQGAKW
jgi:hypothetical protein